MAHNSANCVIIPTYMQEQFIKSYLVAGSVAILGCLGLVLTLLYSSPVSTGVVALFYALVFITIFASVVVVEIFARRKFAPGNFDKLLKSAVRQSFFLAVLVVSLLYLQAENLLLWWVGLTIVLFFMCLDIVCSI